MEHFDLVRLIAWICMVFWLIWYASVQLERLNAGVFGKAKNMVSAKLEKSSGVFRLFGAAMYSPYVRPVTSLVTWLFIATVLFIF